MKIIQNADIKNKKILLRVDFNVPIKDGQIISDQRIREALPTINYLLENGAGKITIITHLGEPGGQKDLAYSLLPIVNRLGELLSLKIKFKKSQDEYQISDPPAGEAGKISMKENLRFNPGEEENSESFAKKLAENQDIFCNDAFGTIHRAHASMVSVTKFLPSYAGLLVQKEVENLDKLVSSKEKPFTVILGGAKIADKIPVLKNLTNRAKNFLIGGAIGSTFLAARRHYLGKSLVEEESFRDANIIYQNILDETDRNIYLPTDLVISHILKKDEGVKIIKTSETLDPQAMADYSIDDIGPKTVEEYKKVILKSKVIFWNGNMGITEVTAFASGSHAIAEAIAQASDSGAFCVVGGGDTVGFIDHLKLEDKMSFVSTGGGATLEYIAGKQLPGLKALE